MWFWAALFGFGGVVASLSTGPGAVLCVVAAVVVCSALLLIRQPALVGFGGAASNGGRGGTAPDRRPDVMTVAPLAPHDDYGGAPASGEAPPPTAGGSGGL